MKQNTIKYKRMLVLVKLIFKQNFSLNWKQSFILTFTM